jgi:hypothetical protein
MGKAAVIGYAANIRAFPFYSCRYQYTKAQAASIEDAIKGVFLNAVSFDSRLIVDGDKVMYESLAPPVEPNLKQMVPVPGKKGVTIVPGSPISSDRYLAAGKDEMTYSPQLQTLGLWSNDQNEVGISPTPLEMVGVARPGHPGVEKMLTQTEKYEISSQRMQEVEGRPLVTVDFRNKKHGYVLQYSFDVGRGYLPVRGAVFFAGKPKVQKLVTDVRECSNQRWFPDRSLNVVTPDKGELLDVMELKLLEFDADHRPDPSEFAISVPAGTTVNHQTDPSKVQNFFRLKQDEKIHVEDFSKLYALIDGVKTTPLMDTAIPRSSPDLWVRWVGGTLGVFLALGGSFYLVRRRLRRQTA